MSKRCVNLVPLARYAEAVMSQPILHRKDTQSGCDNQIFDT